MSYRFLFRTFLICISLLLAGCLGGLFYTTHYLWIDLSSLERHSPGLPSIILDDEGNELARFQLDKRKPISLLAMPQHLINAFIAAEDWRFFEHGGISFKGIIRSSLVNLYHGRRVQGASTITQQLVRLLFLDAKKTFSRKLKEQLVALQVERRFTKEQILETYLNHVYFGCGIYGVEAACQRFWNISCAQITIDQAATLAAIMRSPAQYCPLLCPLSSERRRNIILSSMHKLGFITQEQYTDAVATPLQVNQAVQETIAPHVREMIRQQMEDLVGKQMLYSGGLVIQTTINASLQKKAQQLFHEYGMHMRRTLKARIDGGLVSMQVTTGQIKALVGGIDFKESQFNRATQAKRQMGSIFKPLIYAVAVEKGMQFNHVEEDEPIEVIIDGKSWRPKNNDGEFHGAMTTAYALSHSNNIVAIKTLLTYGVDPVIKLAKRCQLSGLIGNYPSLAVGCVDATVVEAVGMFNVFAHDGVYSQPHLVRWVKDQWGAKIWKVDAHQERVVASQVNGQVAEVLTHWANRVRAFYPPPWIESQMISKTGTTNDSRTCWFIGSTPELTTGIYIGCDDNQSMGVNIYPLKTAFPLWLAYMKEAESGAYTFTHDPSLKEIWIDEKSGQQVEAHQSGAVPIFL